MHANWQRALTLNEKLYGIGEELNPPFAMQFIIKGDNIIDPRLFNLAIDQLVDAYPMLSLKLEHKKWSYKGGKPLVLIHNKQCPEDFSSPLYRKKMNSNNGECFEFHLFQTEVTTIVIRILHSAMDGIGAMKMITTMFAILKGETAEKISIHPTEKELRNQIKVKRATNGGGFTNKWSGLRPTETGILNDFSTRLMRFPSKIDNGIAKLVKWYARETNSTAQFLIPVNCRRHGAYTEVLSNLSLPIYLKTEPNQSINEIQAELLKQLAANKELGVDPLEKIANLLPLFVLKRMFAKKAGRSFKSNKYAMSGYISDLGFIDLDTLSFGGFNALDFYSIPVYTSTIPICFSVVHHKFGTRICYSLSSKYNADNIKSSLESALKPEKSSESNIDVGILISPLELEIAEIWTKYLQEPVSEKDFIVSFTSLGGESLNLLFIVEEIGGKHCANKQGLFLSEVLKQAGSISIRQMAEAILKFKS